MMQLGKEIGLGPGHIVLYGDPVGTQPPQQPLATSAHVCCGQMVAHLSNCWALVAYWLRYCTDVAERRSTKLCTTFGRLLGWYTIGALAPNGILSGAKFTLRSCPAFCYIGSVTARH